MFRKEREINCRNQNNELSGRHTGLDGYIELAREEQNNVRDPKIQLDVIVLELRRTGRNKKLHLSKIYTSSRAIAEEFGLKFDWANWHNRVRGRINDNTTVNKDGKRLFVRAPDENHPSGVRRLLDIGWHFFDKSRLSFNRERSPALKPIS